MCKRHGHGYHNVLNLSAVKLSTKSLTQYPVLPFTTSAKETETRSTNPQGRRSRHAPMLHDVTFISPICSNTKSYHHSRSILIQSPRIQPAQCDHKVSHFNTLKHITRSPFSTRSSMPQRLTIQRAHSDHKVLYFSASRSSTKHCRRTHHDHAMHTHSLSSSRSDTSQRQKNNHARKQHGPWLRHVLVRNIVTLHNTITVFMTSCKPSHSLLSHGLSAKARSSISHRLRIRHGHTSHIAGNDTTLCIFTMSPILARSVLHHRCEASSEIGRGGSVCMVAPWPPCINRCQNGQSS